MTSTSRKENTATKSAKQELYDTLSMLLTEKLKELGQIVDMHKSAKTKTKKDYLQKKLNAKREEVLKYMFEIEKVKP